MSQSKRTKTVHWDRAKTRVPRISFEKPAYLYKPISRIINQDETLAVCTVVIVYF